MRWLTLGLARVFRGVFVLREARARAVARAANGLGLATDQELRELEARADLALGRLRRAQEEAR
jgi:hypothetical protein